MRTLPYKLGLLAFALCMIGSASTSAQPSAASEAPGKTSGRAFPWKVIQMIVPSPAGSPPDVRARELAEKVAPLLGQPVIVINKPGAGGAIGLQAGATSTPDGHTIVFCTDSPLTVNPSMYEKLPYDPEKDFTPVMVVFQLSLVLVVNPSLSVNSVPDLIQVARSRPGKLFYGSAGNGTPPHIFADLFKFTAGLDMVHVPYKGGPAATAALLAGDVGFTFDAPSQVLPHIHAGKLKALAVTGNQRLSALRDVPTFAEIGVAGMSAGWIGIVAPAGTPRDTVMRLNREFTRVLNTPRIRDYYETIGVKAVGSSPEELARRIREETPKWREIVKRAGITPG